MWGGGKGKEKEEKANSSVKVEKFSPLFVIFEITLTESIRIRNRISNICYSYADTHRKVLTDVYAWFHLNNMMDGKMLYVLGKVSIMHAHESRFRLSTQLTTYTHTHILWTHSDISRLYWLSLLSSSSQMICWTLLPCMTVTRAKWK